MDEGLPTLWLHHHTDEPHLLRDGEDGTRISCIYESVAHGLKTADARIPSMTMDDMGKYKEGNDVLLRFAGSLSPKDILQTGFRARMKKITKGIALGDLTEEQVQAMGYKSLSDLVKAKEIRYPIIRKLWEPESLTIAHVQFEVLEELKNLQI
jgi:hypothetical protein